MSAPVDYSREAVERLRVRLMLLDSREHPDNVRRDAADMVVALRAALDAAEQRAADWRAASERSEERALHWQSEAAEFAQKLTATERERDERLEVAKRSDKATWELIMCMSKQAVTLHRQARRIRRHRRIISRLYAKRHDAAAARAEVVAKAKREAFEKAAIEADRVAARAHTALQEPGIIDAIRRDYLHQRNGAREAAAAIRARGEGGGA